MNPQLRRLLLDLGPLFIFFGTFQFFGIFVATAAFIPAILVALAVGYYLERKLSPMAIVTALIVVVFGGLTLYFKNAVFLKMKPTVIYLMFASALIGGLWFDRLFIKYALSFEFELPEATWRSLTWRWGIFFLALAALNEAVWRNFSEANWVFFKVWIILPLIFLFGAAQAPLLVKHMKHEDTPAA
ncbi:MAG: septation protein A [Alphaproteobacteria bacterium]|nr:septation protein A [Alphaproteobacteria bacterium]MBL6936685.1 septation protein A [Alphaproteobacteria bacterium]MBL7097454.1 septation protein A [Alphaproteobacteria bacterium]